MPDLVPPVLSDVRTTGPTSIELRFDEHATIDAAACIIQPDLRCIDIVQSANPVIVTTGAQVPGQEYLLEADVSDANGNSTNIVFRFYGHNPDVPRIIINEFITNGSDTHPDLVELRVMSNGNMAGVALHAGVKENYDSVFVFPSLPVRQGDYILVHCKPSGMDGEIDETSRKDESAGLEASPVAYDFWVRGGTGLSGNNGTLSLYTSPSGELIDGVLYSNRTSSSDTEYLGFGTVKTRERALALAAAGGWNPSGQTIAPDDGVNPERSTATRSICRDSVGTDTDTKSDWHIAPTRGATFGSVNSDAVFVE